MKKLIPLLLAPVLFYTCKKDNAITYTATVVENKGCGENTYRVNFTGTALPLQCGADSVTICGEQAFILNLPVSLQVPGKRFSFRKWSNKGNLCISAFPSPQHLEIYSPIEIP